MYSDSLFPCAFAVCFLVFCSGAISPPWPDVIALPAPDVMATVNGKDILSSEVEKYYKASLGENQAGAQSRSRRISCG